MSRAARLCIAPLLGAILLAVLWAPAVMGKPAGNSSGAKGRVGAIVNGEPIYLNSLNSAEIAKTRKELYGLEQSMLQQVVLEKLRKQKPKEFKNGKIRLTEDEIARVYKEAGLSSRGTLNSFRGRIREYLVRSKTQQMEDEQFKQAVQKGYVISKLTAPPPYLFQLERVNRPASTQGPENAPVTIVEFSDFQ